MMFLYPFPCGIFLCLVVLFLLQKIWQIIICSSSCMKYWFLLTMVTARPWMWGLTVMGRTVRGKWESNSQSAPLSHLFVCVDMLFQRENSLTVSASDCFSTSLELPRKSEGCWVVFFLPLTFTRAHAFLFVIRIPNFGKEHSSVSSEDHYCMTVCKQASPRQNTGSSEWWRTATWFLSISLSSFCL